MSEVLTAVRQELALSRESVFGVSGTTADRPRVYIVGSSSSPTLEEAMERVRQEEIGGRETMAEAFVGRVSSNPSVREVWLSDSGDEAVVHVVVDGVSLEQELALEAIFTAVLSAHGQAFSGYLHIHTLQEGVPVEARSGWRLFPE